MPITIQRMDHATRRPGRLLALAAAAAAVTLTALATLDAPGAEAASCKTNKAKFEPPCNPALPASPWGTPHRSSYAQGSAAVAGILPGRRVRAQHIQVVGAPIVLEFSNKYRDGGRAGRVTLCGGG